MPIEKKRGAFRPTGTRPCPTQPGTIEITKTSQIMSASVLEDRKPRFTDLKFARLGKWWWPSFGWGNSSNNKKKSVKKRSNSFYKHKHKKI